ncbi:MAG: hypothetical protein NTZ33_13815 [Bacteroidetes bacterium]|nr:hypothetical protein [Bacteroidota bacterium]
MFNVDLDILIRQNIASCLNKDRFFAMLKCFITPIKVLYADFQNFRIDANKRLDYTGQVIYLEKLLNDKYAVNTIFIEDVADVEYTYISTKAEGYPLYLSNLAENADAVYLSNAAELVVQYHFIVKIPLALYNNLGAAGLDRMRALINQYRIAGKQFLIQSI